MNNKPEKDEHCKLIGSFLPDLAHIGFMLTTRERAILRKYGAWMEALVSGKISPFSPEQERFIQVSKGHAEAVTEFEKTWENVMKAREKNKNMPSKPQIDVYIPHPLYVQVCPQCGMVDSNCTCGRSWY